MLSPGAAAVPVQGPFWTKAKTVCLCVGISPELPHSARLLTPPSSLTAAALLIQVAVQHVNVVPCVIQQGSGLRQHSELCQRLVHVLGQEDDAHVEGDVLHQERIVQDENVDEEQSHVEHIGGLMQRLPRGIQVCGGRALLGSRQHELGTAEQLVMMGLSSAAGSGAALQAWSLALQ